MKFKWTPWKLRLVLTAEKCKKRIVPLHIKHPEYPLFIDNNKGRSRYISCTASEHFEDLRRETRHWDANYLRRARSGSARMKRRFVYYMLHTCITICITTTTTTTASISVTPLIISNLICPVATSRHVQPTCIIISKKRKRSHFIFGYYSCF
jgi:hypothetical protein